MQADARLVEHVQHAHQAGADLRRQPDALRLAARERARAAVEAQIIEADAEQQLEAAANLLQHLPAGVGAAPGRLDRAEERVQLVEVELADVVDGLSRDGEQEARPPHPGAVAVGTGLLDHYLVEPFLHPRAGLAALAIAAVVALDAAGDAMEADLAPLVLLALRLRLRRRHERDLAGIDAVENRLPRRLRQRLPRRVE
jgi:hypothetical protein